MDSKPIFASLLELFPQIDSRILKAAAIEHYNDIDAAVGFIVNDVLPTLYGLFNSSYSIHDTHELSDEVEPSEYNISKRESEAHQPEYLARGTYISGDTASSMSYFTGKAKETISDIKINKHYSNPPSVLGNHPDFIEFDTVVNDVNNHDMSRSVEYTDKLLPVALKSVHDISSSVVNDKSMNLVECRAEALNDNEFVSLEHDGSLPMIHSARSSHINNIDLLENCVMNAKNNKKTLASEVELGFNLMIESELLLDMTRQAADQALLAGQDILAKVEELKLFLQNAKQANDMHAGEVYGEKAILATEAREFQSRLVNLSDDRNKAFTVIEEIRATLEARLAAAKDKIAAAEQEKIENESSALKALKEQEALMNLIVQESKQLQQEAEENAKLREFLVDRSRAVDTLQGEMAVIFEDVMLLKKRVDEHAPLKGSMLLTTYGSATSSSSLFTRNSISSSYLSECPKERSEELLSNEEQEHVFDTSCYDKPSNNIDKHWTLDDEWELLRSDISRSNSSI